MTAILASAGMRMFMSGLFFDLIFFDNSPQNLQSIIYDQYGGGVYFFPTKELLQIISGCGAVYEILSLQR